MYFTEPELQGEYLKEIQSLVCDLKEDTIEVSNKIVEVSDVSSQNRGDFNDQNLDLNRDEHTESQDTSEFNTESLLIHTPNQSLRRNVPNTVLEPVRRQLPHVSPEVFQNPHVNPNCQVK